MLARAPRFTIRRMNVRIPLMAVLGGLAAEVFVNRPARAAHFGELARFLRGAEAIRGFLSVYGSNSTAREEASELASLFDRYAKVLRRESTYDRDESRSAFDHFEAKVALRVEDGGTDSPDQSTLRGIVPIQGLGVHRAAILC